MQPSDASFAEAPEVVGVQIPPDALQTFEQMLEAEIMGTAVYPDEPEATLFEERLAELQQTDSESAKPAIGSSPFDRDLAVGTPSVPQALKATSLPEIGRSPIAVAPGETLADLASARPPRASSSFARQPNPRLSAPRRNRRRFGPGLLYVVAAALFAVSSVLFTHWAASDRTSFRLPHAESVIEEVGQAASVTLRDIFGGTAENADAKDSSSASATTAAPSTTTIRSPDSIDKALVSPARKVRLYRVDAAGNIEGYAVSQ